MHRIEKMQENQGVYNYKRSPKKISHQNSLPFDNNYIQKETLANQWKDTSPVIEWFVNIKEKEHSSFMHLILKVFTLQ